MENMFQALTSLAKTLHLCSMIICAQFQHMRPEASTPISLSKISPKSTAPAAIETAGIGRSPWQLSAETHSRRMAWPGGVMTVPCEYSRGHWCKYHGKQSTARQPRTLALIRRVSPRRVSRIIRLPKDLIHPAISHHHPLPFKALNAHLRAETIYGYPKRHTCTRLGGRSSRTAADDIYLFERRPLC